jgi:hypothetical protein
MIFFIFAAAAAIAYAFAAIYFAFHFEIFAAAAFRFSLRPPRHHAIAADISPPPLPIFHYMPPPFSLPHIIFAIFRAADIFADFADFRFIIFAITPCQRHIFIAAAAIFAITPPLSTPLPPRC